MKREVPDIATDKRVAWTSSNPAVAAVSPFNATNKKVTWTSSNTAVATVDANGKVTAKSGGTATITAKTADGGKTASCKVTVDDRTQRVPSISYRTHVQKYGWQDWRKDGDMSGTTGESKRLEAININVSNLPYDGGITYRTHVQKYGWQTWKSNGDMAGTSGEGKRLEAIQIQLTGEMAKHYDVYYQTHIQHFGWSGWASNGEMCGSAGYAYRLEGIRIKLVKKGEAAPGKTTNPFYGKAGSGSPVSKGSGALVGYNTHVQTYGWLDWAKNGAMAGTSGLAKRLEGINIVLVPKGGKAPGNTARPNVVGGGGKLPDNPYKE